MRETVLILLEIQELELVRDESQILHQGEPSAKLREVETKIAGLRADISESILKRYDILRRGGAAVVKTPGGICNGCRLNLNKGDLNRMRKNQVPCSCPHCGRFLVVSDEEGS